MILSKKCILYEKTADYAIDYPQTSGRATAAVLGLHRNQLWEHELKCEMTSELVVMRVTTTS